MKNSIKLYIIVAVFLLGLYFVSTSIYKENFEGMNIRCPNLLIQKGPYLYLHNTKLAEVPGVNPLKFNNLEEYVEFLNWQRANNIRCPVLYLKKTRNERGEIEYKQVTKSSKPKPFSTIQVDVDFDEYDPNVKVSADASKANWGGAAFTREKIRSGAYNDNNVSIMVE